MTGVDEWLGKEYKGVLVGSCGKLWGKLPLSVDNFMLIGEYIYSIDQKKRLAIPAKFRRSLGRKAVVTRGIDGCLVVYPLNEWAKLAKKLQELPASQVDARGFARIMLAGAVDVAFDKLGRILLPDYLKKYAGLKKEVAILGLSNRLEIWDNSKWKQYKEKKEKQVGEMVSKLTELGI